MGCPPSLLDVGPFGLGKSIDLARLAVVLARAHQVLGIVASCCIPIVTQLLERVHVHSLGLVRLRENCEVGVAEAIRPFIVFLQHRRERKRNLRAVGTEAKR